MCTSTLLNKSKLFSKMILPSTLDPATCMSSCYSMSLSALDAVQLLHICQYGCCQIFLLVLLIFISQINEIKHLLLCFFFCKVPVQVFWLLSWHLFFLIFQEFFVYYIFGPYVWQIFSPSLQIAISLRDLLMNRVLKFNIITYQSSVNYHRFWSFYFFPVFYSFSIPILYFFILLCSISNIVINTSNYSYDFKMKASNFHH